MYDRAKAMIVCVDAQTRQTLRMMLASEVRQILEAASGLGGLVLARREHPDIILLGAGLPRLDGYAVCRRLKEDPDPADIAVVILAGEVEAGADKRASEAGEAGADDVIAGLLKGIVGIEIEITRIEGKWKANQNRPQADQVGVVAGLSGQSDDASRAMAQVVAERRAAATRTS